MSGPQFYDVKLDRVYDFGSATEYHIGRAASCHINIPEMQISRCQCVVSKFPSVDGDIAWIVSNRSTFITTYVNDVKVPRNGTKLKSGDVVSVGPCQEHKFIFYNNIDDMPPAQKRCRLTINAGPVQTKTPVARKRARDNSDPVSDKRECFSRNDLEDSGADIITVANDFESAPREATVVKDNPERIIDSPPSDLDDEDGTPNINGQTIGEFTEQCVAEVLKSNDLSQIRKEVQKIARQLYSSILKNRDIAANFEKKLSETEKKKSEAVNYLKCVSEELSKSTNDKHEMLEEINRLAQERNDFLEEVELLKSTREQPNIEIETELIFKSIELEEAVNELRETKTELNDIRTKYDTVTSENKQRHANIVTLIEQEFFCAVCNDLLYQPVVIDCRHVFCKDCLKEWKKKKRECPSCRTVITRELSPLMLDGFLDRIAPLLGDDFVAKRRETISERMAPTSPVRRATTGLTRRVSRGGRPRRRGARPGVTRRLSSTSADGAREAVLAQYISDIIELI